MSGNDGPRKSRANRLMGLAYVKTIPNDGRVHFGRSGTGWPAVADCSWHPIVDSRAGRCGY